MLYILIIDMENHRSVAGDEKYSFKHFNAPNDLISYVSNMSMGDNKVHKIVSLDYNGNAQPMTINFSMTKGKLDLVRLESPEEIFGPEIKRYPAEMYSDTPGYLKKEDEF